MLIGYTILVALILFQALFYLIKNCMASRWFLLVCSYLDILFLAACRNPIVTSDDLGYLRVFWGQSSCYFEPGLCKLNHVIRLFGTQTYVYFGALAVLIFTPIWLFIQRYSRNILFSVLTFVCLMYAYNAVNIVRQFLALAIILMGFPFVIKRKFWLFVMCVGIASLFHSSAVLCLSFYWLYQMKASARNIGILFLVSIIGCVLFDYLASVYVSLGVGYGGYLAEMAQQTKLSGIIRFVLNFIIMVSFLTTIKFTSVDKLRQSKLNVDFLALCSCVSVSSALIALQAYHAERIAYYFYFFNVVTIPEILQNISSKPLRYFIAIIIGLCLFCYGLVVLWSWKQKGMSFLFLWN